MAVVRSIVAKMAAETSNWESGMARASRSLSDVNSGILDFKEEMAQANSLMEVAGKGHVYTSATTERLANENKLAAIATEQHARQARYLTSVIEELAAAERASVPIINQVADSYRNVSQAAGSAFGADLFGGKLAAAGGLGKLIKMGGALAVIKIAAHEATRSIEQLNTAVYKLRTNDTESILALEFGKAIPILGLLVEEGEKAGRAARELRTGELAANEMYQRRLDAQIAFMDNLKKEQELRIQQQKDDEDFTRKYLRDQKLKAKAAEEAGEAYRAAVEEKRRADEEQLRRERFGNFNFVEDAKRFVEEQAKEQQRINDAIAKEIERGIQVSVENQNTANAKEAARKTTTPEDSATLFGSSDAARIQGRAERGNAEMLSELRKIRQEIARKANTTVEVKDLN